MAKPSNGWRRLISRRSRMRISTLPETPMEHSRAAAEAVYRSWMSDRAVTYRKLETSARSCAAPRLRFRRWCSAMAVYRRVQGLHFRAILRPAPAPVIDVMFGSPGRRCRVRQTYAANRSRDHAAAARSGGQLRAALARLEGEFSDVQDVEFTIENGKLWLLQTRSAKRAPRAALRFAIDFVSEGRIAPAEALRRLKGVDLDRLGRQRLANAGPPSGTAPAHRPASPSAAPRSIRKVPRASPRRAIRSFSFGLTPRLPMSRVLLSPPEL